MSYLHPPNLPLLPCIGVGVLMDEGIVFTSLMQPDNSSFSTIPLSPHLNLKASSQPFIPSTLFVRWRRTISPVPKLGNWKSGRFNYGQTSCCSSYWASINRLACSSRVTFFFQNSPFKICISKLTTLVTETFRDLPGITQKVCGEAVTMSWS